METDEDVLIRSYPGMAIVTGRSTRRRAGSNNSITQIVRFMRVYADLAGRWQVVSAQATPILE